MNISGSQFRNNFCTVSSLEVEADHAFARRGIPVNRTQSRLYKTHSALQHNADPRVPRMDIHLHLSSLSKRRSQSLEKEKDNERLDAEIFQRDTCQEKTQELLTELGLPNGLLPLTDITEFGHNKETGFVWWKQTKATTYFWRSLNKTVSYAEEITAYVDKRRMTKLTGMKSKELLVWVTIGEIYIDESNLERIEFKNVKTGISLAYPVSAFRVEDKKKDGDGVGFLLWILSCCSSSK